MAGKFLFAQKVGARSWACIDNKCDIFDDHFFSKGIITWYATEILKILRSVDANDYFYAAFLIPRNFFAVIKFSRIRRIDRLKENRNIEGYERMQNCDSDRFDPKCLMDVKPRGLGRDAMEPSELSKIPYKYMHMNVSSCVRVCLWIYTSRAIDRMWNTREAPVGNLAICRTNIVEISGWYG